MKFTKGCIPWNKGTKGLMKPNSTSFKKGETSWNKGIPAPWTSERNINVNPTKRGKEAYHWKGGTYGTERHRDMSRSEYKKWRISVFERDDYTCQHCKIRGCELQAHHIKSWKNHPELRYDIANGLTLCISCHRLTFKDK